MLIDDPEAVCSGIRRSASEQSAELVAFEARVAQDARKGSSFQLAMERNDEKRGPVRMAEADVAPSLPHDLPANLFKRTDQLSAGNDRQPLSHAGSGSLRRTMPAPTPRPASRSPST